MTVSGFCLKPGVSSRESLAVFSHAERLGYRIKRGTPQDGYCPVGDVDYCISAMPSLGLNAPQFYPPFLWNSLKRRVYQIDLSGMFLKPAWAWKADTPAKVWENGSFWVSSPVEFENEWRYYITNGEVVASGWYIGKDENEPPPDLSFLGIRWPKEYCGAVDFGRVGGDPSCSKNYGEIALVEAHDPFACGWYGESVDGDKFVKWLADGWDYLTKRQELVR